MDGNNFLIVCIPSRPNPASIVHPKSTGIWRELFVQDQALAGSRSMARHIIQAWLNRVQTEGKICGEMFLNVAQNMLAR